MALSAAIAVASTWLGLVLSYEIDSLPASSAIVGYATAAFLGAAALAWLRQRGLVGRGAEATIAV
jgi:ABC-type Mn2+/Zn2+ transport system permease subunit